MSILEDAWQARGRALFGVPEPTHALPPVSTHEALRTIARRLRASLRGLSERDFDVAVAAAAGYLEAHWAHRAVPTSAAGPAPPDARRTPAPARPAEAPPPRGRARSTPTTFTVIRGHALAKGLAAGRAHIRTGELALAAVVRRIAADTRCAVLGVVEEGEAPGAGMPRTYRVTLRGHLRPRRQADAPVEGDLWVAVRCAEGA